MISKHSSEQSVGGEGVEVLRNEPDTHPQHGVGQVTEKRVYLSRWGYPTASDPTTDPGGSRLMNMSSP